MRLRRTGATIAAGVLAGAAAIGFGLGTAQADPVPWTGAADTTASLSMSDDPPSSRDLPTGEFNGEADEDAGTITGDVTHPEFAFEVDNPLGDGEVDLTVALDIEDIDLAWDQDDDSAEGTALLRLHLLHIDIGSGIDFTNDGEDACHVDAPIAVDGSYVDGTLNFIGGLDETELIGDCAGLASIIEGSMGNISGQIETTITDGPVPEPEETTTTTDAEETTTTEAEETPAPEAPGNGATPIPATPSYIG